MQHPKFDDMVHPPLVGGVGGRVDGGRVVGRGDGSGGVGAGCGSGVWFYLVMGKHKPG